MGIFYSCVQACLRYTQKKFSKIFFGVFVLFILGMGNVGWGQTIIASDGLNNSTTLFTFSVGAYYTGNSAAGDRPASTAFYSEGTHSYGVSNGTATLTSNDINTSSYSGINLSFTLASFSISSTGNGADGADNVTVEISPNGGTTWYPTVGVSGNSNAYWDFTTGTATASTPYDGNFTSVNFSPAGGGSRTVDGYSAVQITNIPSVTNLKIRITLLNNDNNERWLIDDFKVTGNFTITSLQNGDWSTPSTWIGNAVPASTDNVVINHKVSTGALGRSSGTTTTINPSGILAVSGQYDNQGTTNVNGKFQLEDGGYAAGNNFVYGATGTLNFNTTGNYGVNNDQYWPAVNGPYNVSVLDTGGIPAITMNVSRTVNGTFQTASGVNISGANVLTLNSICRINTGGYFSNSPTYGNASTLVYNTGGSYNVGNEWTGNLTTAGIGRPQNVTIQSSSTINMPNANRGMAGNLNITSGSLNLNGGSGDLYIAGNWSRASGAVFNPNTRAVFFNGSGTQTVTIAGGGVEDFDYLQIAGSGTMKLATGTSGNVNKLNGLTLSSTNATSTLDLNGNTFTLTGTGNVNLSGGARKVTSSVAGGIFKTTGATTSYITINNGGSISFDANTTVLLINGINCGTGSLTTIFGTLEIGTDGFVRDNSPKYAMGSLLKYTSGGIYDRKLEWTSPIGPLLTPGLPYNVQITNGTTLNYINALNPGPKGILGNLTIDNAPPVTSSLEMDYGSVSSVGALTVVGNVTVSGNLSLGFAIGDDLKTRGDFILNSTATLTTHNRAIYFIKDILPQNLTSFLAGTLTLPKIILGYPGGSGTTLKINQNTMASVNVANWDVITFTNATDEFDINGKTLTIGQAGFNNTILGPGSFNGSASSNISLLGNGNAGTFTFKVGGAGSVLDNFSIDRTGGMLAATLGSVLTINTKLFLNNGFLNIAGNNLYFNSGASVGGSPSLNSFIQADGAGYVIKDFTSASPFAFPIGDATGTVEYSPASVNFSSGTFSSGEFGVNVIDAKHPNNNVATNYITRYWTVTSLGITNFIADLSFTYVPADVVGPTEANINTGGWDNVNWYQYNPTNAGTHTLSVSATNSFKNSYTGGDVFTPLGSLITDYFRSKAPGGNWNVVGSWESSPNGVSGWHDATVVPTSGSQTITIQALHTIIVNTTISLDQTVINGILSIQGNGILNLNNGTGDDIKINSGGIYQVLGNKDYTTQINYSVGALIHILSGGKISIGNGASVTGTNLDRYSTNTTNTWDDGSIFEWNNTGTFGSSNLTYFPNAAVGIKPIFRVTKNGGTPGGGSYTTINGIFQVNDNVNFGVGSTKNFRDGITGNSTLTQLAGSFHINNANAILGGAALKIILTSPLVLENNVTVPSDSIVTVSGGNINNNLAGNVFKIYGTLDVTTIQITNTNGSVNVYGKYRTANPGDFTWDLSSIPSGSVTVYPNSTIELYALGDQKLKARSDFANLTFSGSGSKTVSNSFVPVGTVTIQDDAILDCTPLRNIGDGSSSGPTVTNLTMTGNSRLRLGTISTNPMMGGTYNLTGGVVEFNSSQIGAQTIRNKTYQNIEVTGNNVANSGGNISLNPAGTFKIKNNGVFTIENYSITGITDGTAGVIVETGGTFKTANTKGFNGYLISYFPTISSSINSNITNITLQPGSTVEYTRNIPDQTSEDQPITVANGLVYQNLTLSGSGNKIAPSDTAILTIEGNFKKLTTSTFVHNVGTVLFNGASPQTYLSVNPIMMFYNMTNNSNNLIVNDTIAVLKKLILTDPSTVTLNNDIVMRSNDTTTANIAEIVNATIAYTAGRFIVERYIPGHSKAWQFLAVPTKESTINEAWQEGSSNMPGPLFDRKPGFGTTISSNQPFPLSLGFDMPSFSPSMKKYNSATDNFTGVPNTTSLIDNRAGYFLFVRGDRSVTGVGQPATSTILRTRGKIYAPTPSGEAPTPVTINPSSYTSVGNPYASSIDFYSLTRTGFSTGSYYIYDPQLTISGYSAYGYGGYRTISGSVSVPSSGNYINGNIPPIQSGQAFFVDNPGAVAGSISFLETAKVNGSRSIFRAAGRDGDFTEPDAQLRGNLYVNYNNEYILIDGELTQFQSSYDAGLDGLDARKLMNNGENMGINSNNITLAIERRPLPIVTDTLFYQLNHMKQNPYRFEFIASKMDISGLEGYVYDQFLKTETKLKMSDTTYIDFNITGDEHSSASNRFMIYFKPAAGPVPVTFTNVNAHLQNKDVIVEWKTENEKEMNGYTLHASLDGINFKPLTFIKATNNGVGNYAYTDADAIPGYHYYRVQSVDANGKTALTRIVKVWVGSGKHLITIYPNPIRNNEVNLQFEGQVQGEYKVRLLNSAGQVLAAKEINFAGGSGNETIQLDQYTAQGVYHLEITQPDGKMLVLKVMK